MRIGPKTGERQLLEIRRWIWRLRRGHVSNRDVPRTGKRQLVEVFMHHGLVVVCFLDYWWSYLPVITILVCFRLLYSLFVLLQLKDEKPHLLVSPYHFILLTAWVSLSRKVLCGRRSFFSFPSLLKTDCRLGNMKCGLCSISGLKIDYEKPIFLSLQTGGWIIGWDFGEDGDYTTHLYCRI